MDADVNISFRIHTMSMIRWFCYITTMLVYVGRFVNPDKYGGPRLKIVEYLSDLGWISHFSALK